MIRTALPRYLILAVFLTYLAPMAYAQPEPELVAEAPEPAAETADPAAEPEAGDLEAEGAIESGELDAAPVVRSGDMLHLRSGQIFSDVQILRSTPRFYEVQFVDGLTMEVPRTQVESVEFDDIDPLDLRRDKMRAPVASTDNAVEGMEVGEELAEKLRQPVSDTPLVYIDADIITILENLTRRKEVAFEVDESVRALPIDSRVIRIEITPALNFGQLFQDRLPEILPDLVVVYETDKVRLVTRAVAHQQQTSGQTPAPRPNARALPGQPAVVPPPPEGQPVGAAPAGEPTAPPNPNPEVDSDALRDAPQPPVEPDPTPAPPPLD